MASIRSFFSIAPGWFTLGVTGFLALVTVSALQASEPNIQTLVS